MKRELLAVILIGWAFIINAQPLGKPSWVIKRPTSSNSTFYYRVTVGEGINYDKAYANAFAKAILESSWRLGMPVYSGDDLIALENGVYENITIGENQMNIALNKVCEYTERLETKTGIRIFILWQVATVGIINPLFDEFNDCE